jgi:ribosomal protein S18 acetylase RimI-like enzyme
VDRGGALVTRALRAGDFDDARRVADEWFGHPVGLTMHRLFFDQLGGSGVWIGTEDGVMVGVLLGLRSQPEPDLAYIHFHMVDPTWRGQGVGSRLYTTFFERMAGLGCTRVRALAAPTRTASIRFHEALGFSGRHQDGYLGPGEDRVIFERPIGERGDATA